MRCAEVEALLDRAVEEGVDLLEAVELQSHAADCPRCREAMERHLEFLRVLEGAPDTKAPPGFSARVMARVRTQAGRKPNYFPSPAQVVFAVAVLVVLCMLVIAAGDRLVGADIFSRSYFLGIWKFYRAATVGLFGTHSLQGGVALIVPLSALAVLLGAGAIVAARLTESRGGGGHGT